jgi:hypothetical protein
MHNSTEPVPLPTTNRDLPSGWYRVTPEVWKNDRGKRFRFVPRRRVRNLSAEDKARAVVVLRFRPGFHPSTVEGAVVRSLLLDQRVMHLKAILPRLQAWYRADDTWEYFLRAVADKNAYLSVLVAVDER